MKTGKQIITFILAAAMMLSCVQSVAFAGAEFTIYNTSFEDEKIVFEQKSGKAEYTADDARTEKKSVRLSGYSDETGAPRITLTEVNREATSNISVWVKPEKDEKTTFELWLFLKTAQGEKKYKLGEKSSAGRWVNLSGKMYTKYITMTSSPRIAVTARTADGIASCLIDDFTVTSDRASAAEENPVEELKPTGKYTIRASFEKNTLEYFKLNGTAEYFITDEVPAHTGTHCMKITNRQLSDGTMMMYFDKAAKDAKINFSCWVRTPPGQGTKQYTLQAIIPTGSGKKWPAVSASTAASDNGWTQLTGTIDCTQYKVTGAVGIQIVAGVNIGGFFDYYVDDVYVTTDTDGDLYDDMNYEPQPRDENMSATPYQPSPNYVEIQDDIPSLKDVFKNYFKIGAAIQNRTESDTTRYGRLVKKHFNSIVSDGLYQMGEILRDKNDYSKYTFDYPDRLFDFAKRNGMEMTGHVLVWETKGARKYVVKEDGSYLDKDSVLKFLKEYITTVMKHFEGDGAAEEYLPGVDYSDWHIEAWNVVNEAVSGVDSEGNINYRRNGSWFEVLGADYIDYAFKFAEETGYNNVALRYNDFMEGESVYKLVKGLLDRGRRVDIVGIQSHYNADTLVSNIRKTFQLYMGLGLSIDVTELDLKAYTSLQRTAKKVLYEKGLPKEVEFSQATIYAELFKLYREYAEHINRIVFWTFADNFSFENRDSSFLRTEYCGIFDRDYQAKPQFWAIVDPEKYYNEILKENNKVTRLVVNAVQTKLKDDDKSIIDEKGVKYMEISELLDNLGIAYVKLGGKYNFIKNGVFFEIKDGDMINKAFEGYKMQNPILERDGSIYAPIIELTTLMGYSNEYNTDRNMINISGK